MVNLSLWRLPLEELQEAGWKWSDVLRMSPYWNSSNSLTSGTASQIDERILGSVYVIPSFLLRYPLAEKACKGFLVSRFFESYCSPSLPENWTSFRNSRDRYVLRMTHRQAVHIETITQWQNRQSRYMSVLLGIEFVLDEFHLIVLWQDRFF